jgi:aspartyl protease family protein
MADFEGPWGAAAQPPPPRPRLRLGLVLWLMLRAAAAGIIALLAWLFPGQLAGRDWAWALGLFGFLAMISRGALTAGRSQLAATARYAAIWVAIIALGLGGYVFRDDLAEAAARLRSAIIPGYAAPGARQAVVVGRAEDGAFYVMAQVDGAPVRFLIDTGASDIVLSPGDAQRAGLGVGALRYSSAGETAGGTAFGAPATVRRLSVGPIALSDVPVFINQRPMGFSLLGMPFLRRLRSFEVRGDQLFLRR